MDIESADTLKAAADHAADRFQTVGETLIASFFGNLTIFVDETLPKMDVLLTRQLNSIQGMLVGLQRNLTKLRITGE